VTEPKKALAHIIAGGSLQSGFRLVRVEDGDKVAHVLEVPDGQTALGEERWREFNVRGNKHLENLFSYFIKLATEQE